MGVGCVILVYILVRKEHLSAATAIHAGWIFYGAVSLVAMGFFVLSDFRPYQTRSSKQPD